MTKNEIMKAYVEEKITELCDAVLTFNYADGAAHSVAFLTNYAGKILKKYVRAADKEYGFTILITWHYSSELDDLNLQAMNLGQLFMDWIDEQNRSRNFPKFQGCKVLSIENLQNMPNLAGVNEAGTVARYMFQVRVRYYTEGVKA